MNWHSPASFWMDIVFGVVPAALLAFMSLYVLVIAVVFIRNDPAPINAEILGLFVLAVPGFFSSLGLLYSSFARARTKFKPLVISSLAVGVGCAAYLLYFLYFALGFDTGLIVFVVPALSVTVIAIKHIVLLARTPSSSMGGSH